MLSFQVEEREYREIEVNLEFSTQLIIPSYDLPHISLTSR